MKPYLVKMLNEFIERDFSLGEMLEVLYDLHNIQEYQRIREVYRRHAMLEEVIHVNHEEEGARYMAQKELRKYSLDYEIDDLI